MWRMQCTAMDAFEIVKTFARSTFRPCNQSKFKSNPKGLFSIRILLIWLIYPTAFVRRFKNKPWGLRKHKEVFDVLAAYPLNPRAKDFTRSLKHWINFSELAMCGFRRFDSRAMTESAHIQYGPFFTKSRALYRHSTVYLKHAEC